MTRPPVWGDAAQLACAANLSTKAAQAMNRGDG